MTKRKMPKSHYLLLLFSPYFCLSSNRGRAPQCGSQPSPGVVWHSRRLGQVSSPQSSPTTQSICFTCCWTAQSISTKFTYRTRSSWPCLQNLTASWRIQIISKSSTSPPFWHPTSRWTQVSWLYPWSGTGFFRPDALPITRPTVQSTKRHT